MHRQYRAPEHLLQARLHGGESDLRTRESGPTGCQEDAHHGTVELEEAGSTILPQHLDVVVKVCHGICRLSAIGALVRAVHGEVADGVAVAADRVTRTRGRAGNTS
eukprot:767259-Hanusia_phi.AAC.3